MEKRGMNERIQALRELSVSTQPHIDMERAKSETETYKKYQYLFHFLLTQGFTISRHNR